MAGENNFTSTQREDTPLINKEIIIQIDAPELLQNNNVISLRKNQSENICLLPKKLFNIATGNLPGAIIDFSWSSLDYKHSPFVPERVSPSIVITYLMSRTGPVLAGISLTTTFGTQIYHFCKLSKTDKTFNNAALYLLAIPTYQAVNAYTTSLSLAYFSALFKQNKVCGSMETLNGTIGAGLGNVIANGGLEVLLLLFKSTTKTLSNGQYFSDHQLDRTQAWHLLKPTLGRFIGAGGFWYLLDLNDSKLISFFENYLINQLGLSSGSAYACAHILKSLFVAGMSYVSTVGSDMLVETGEAIVNSVNSTSNRFTQDPTPEENKEETNLSTHNHSKTEKNNSGSWCCFYKKKSKRHNIFMDDTQKQHTINTTDSEVKDTGLACSIL